MIKIFLDTNIIIDVMEKREPYFLQSANLLELGYKGYVSLYATSLTFINALYISRKSIGKEAAIEKVKLLRNFIGRVDGTLPPDPHARRESGVLFLRSAVSVPVASSALSPGLPASPLLLRLVDRISWMKMSLKTSTFFL